MLANTSADPQQATAYPIYLQHCGSHKRIRIDPQDLPIAANARAVMWNLTATGSRMTGYLLPTLRKFTVTAPSNDVMPVLAERRLYLDNQQTHVWRSTAQVPPDQRVPKRPG